MGHLLNCNTLLSTVSCVWTWPVCATGSLWVLPVLLNSLKTNNRWLSPCVPDDQYQVYSTFLIYFSSSGSAPCDCNCHSESLIPPEWLWLKFQFYWAWDQILMIRKYFCRAVFLHVNYAVSSFGLHSSEM